MSRALYRGPGIGLHEISPADVMPAGPCILYYSLIIPLFNCFVVNKVAQITYKLDYRAFIKLIKYNNTLYF